MGLFAAISLISLVEVAFFMVQATGAKFMKLRNRRKTQVITNVAPKKSTVENRKFSSRCSLFFFTIMDKSDIHGLRYIVEKDKSFLSRLFWLVTVLVSSAICFWQIFNTINHSEMNPIEYAIDQKMWDIKDVRIYKTNNFSD